MNKFLLIIRKNRFFSIIYFLAMACVIGFYCLIGDTEEVVYPILVAILFYVIYMVVDSIIFLHHILNVERLGENQIPVESGRADNQEIYNAMLKIHSKYNSEITRILSYSREDKRFISGCVHNLKTPVTVSSLLLQRAKKGEISCEEAVDNLEIEIVRINEGLNMLLDIQRISEFEKDYELHELNLTQEVREIINANKSLFINSRIYPKVEGEEALVLSDKKWNSVLISQLISNAVKYSKDGTEKHIHFVIEKSDNKVMLSVIDEGIGISEYDIPRAFDAFFTGENGRKGYNSSGIGLYLCKKICDRLNMSIEIGNAPLGGCKVTVSYLTKM